MDMRIQSFTDLKVWKTARKLRVLTGTMTRKFPPHERYKLNDQMTRAARSVAANIAEGFGRFHHQDNMRFCRQARASLCELLEHCICAFDEEYIDRRELADCKNLIDDCRQLLNGYIRSLQRSLDSQKMSTSPITRHASP